VGEQGWYDLKRTLTVEGQAKKFFYSTFLIAGGSIIGMNTSSSQMELVQSWGLGHSSHQILGFEKFVTWQTFIGSV
jgi:hypothetical protein